MKNIFGMSFTNKQYKSYSRWVEALMLTDEYERMALAKILYMDYKKRILVWQINKIKRRKDSVDIRIQTNIGSYVISPCIDNLLEEIDEKIE